MKPGTFEGLVSDLLEKASDVRNAKMKEYHGEVDRLSQFRRSAALNDTNTVQAISGMMAKHTISIYDMVKEDVQEYPLELWEEKIIDQINYLLLMYGAVREEFRGK